MMSLYFEEEVTKGLFMVKKNDSSFKGDGILNKNQDTISTIVFNQQEAQTVTIDQVPYTMPANTVLPLVTNQHFIFEHPEKLVAWQFNRDFYCIANHDKEVSCVGFLFYGIQNPLFIPLMPDELESIILIEKLCSDDMEIRDRMQGEMLRTLLKRLIITITRIAKKQTENYERFTEEKLDIVRMFNLLVECHFKTQHEVQFYANALNKSPKTLSNLFAIFNYPAPSKLIQKRIILEAKRHLQFTDQSAKEIAYMLGFTSPAHFSRFFKQHTGHTISQYSERTSDCLEIK
jgi:AraC family transcriptional activator of pobA